MTTEEKVFEVLENTGLNWTVQKKPLVSVDGDASESFGVYKQGKKWLGTVGPVYELFQNHELAELMVLATEEIGLSVSRGGLLKDGKLVYLQTELPETIIGKSGVKRFVTGLTSHNGSSGIGFGSSNVVIVCQNTFYKAYGEIQSFRHSLTAKERITIALKEMKIAITMDERMIETFKAMESEPLKDEIFARVLAKAFKADPTVKASEISTRKTNQLTTLSQNIETEIGIHGTNLWSLFNGITRYINHHAVKPEKKQEYVMVGAGYRTNLITYNEIMNWLGDKVAPEGEMVFN